MAIVVHPVCWLNLDRGSIFELDGSFFMRANSDTCALSMHDFEASPVAANQKVIPITKVTISYPKGDGISEITSRDAMVTLENCDVPSKEQIIADVKKLLNEASSLSKMADRYLNTAEGRERQEDLQKSQIKLIETLVKRLKE